VKRRGPKRDAHRERGTVFSLPLDHPEFDAMSKWYDFDYERRVRADLPFYLRCAKEGGGPVLELGAGTGRVTAFLAKAGFETVGVELSSAMLARAEARRERMGAAGGRMKLVHGDMSDLRVHGRFGTILAPFRSFNHLYTLERQLAALRGIRRRLAPKGIAAIDLWNPNLEKLSEQQGRVQVAYEREDPRTGLKVVQRFRIRADVPSQMGFLDYWWDAYRGKRRVSRDHAPMRWRWFHRFEFEHLLARAGLAVRAVYGDFDGGSLGPASEELLFVATRPAAPRRRRA
jgi:SAM-dependent methyltransferase